MPPRDGRRAGVATASRHRQAPWLVRLYPPSFRERYGPELTALVEDLGPNRLVITDLLVGAVVAWLRPVGAGGRAERRRRRLQASVASTWVAWCAGFLVAPTVNRMLDDPPVAGLSHLVQHLLDVAQISCWVGGLVLMAATLPLALRSLPTAIGTRNFRLIVPVLPAVVLLVLELVGAGVISLTRGIDPAAWNHPSVLIVSGVLVWVVGFFAFVVAAGIGPAISLTRAQPAERHLRLPAVLGAVVAAALAVTTIASLGAVLVTQAAPFSIVALAVAAVATVVALTSSARGVKAVLAAD